MFPPEMFKDPLRGICFHEAAETVFIVQRYINEFVNWIS